MFELGIGLSVLHTFSGLGLCGKGFITNSATTIVLSFLQ